jgi:Glucose / Sorbosone dehydrogenase
VVPKVASRLRRPLCTPLSLTLGVDHRACAGAGVARLPVACISTPVAPRGLPAPCELSRRWAALHSGAPRAQLGAVFRPCWDARSKPPLFSLRRWLWLYTTACLKVGLSTARALAADGDVTDALADWSVSEGYSLTIAYRGFELPTALAAVPTPARAAKAPKFFVTELRGRIKVIANDGSVSDFAFVPTFKPHQDWPDFSGEAGLAGLCLDAQHGFVFVTYAYRDKDGMLRNGLSRFSTTPGTFEGAPNKADNYSAILLDAPSAFSHQIGGCVVKSDALYISVGDGGNPAATHDLKISLGKILRLTLDGQAHPANPYAAAGGAAALVFAYGLRNTFGLTMIGSRIFAAENGVASDRLLEIHEGRDHGWDGTDASIATNALAVFQPSIGPAHLSSAAANANALAPSAHQRFVIAASNGKQGPGVLLAEIDLQQNYLPSPPRYVVHYDGHVFGEAITGVALTEEGLFFTPILPQGATGVVLRTRYEPALAHARIIGKTTHNLISARGCLGCHSLNGMGGRVGPPLDENSLRTRAETRVLDPSYAALVKKLDNLLEPTMVAGKRARHEVLNSAQEDKVRAWIVNRILNPRFDSADASMPQLGVPRVEAERMADQLLAATQKSRMGELLTSRRYLAGLATGLLAGFSVGLGWHLVLALRRRSMRPVLSTSLPKD